MTENKTLSIEDIMQYLPHRYPFLLIDRVLEIDPHKTIVAQKNVTINESFFCGHFPHYRVMPGVLIIEGMAQAASFLSLYSNEVQTENNFIYYFTGINNAKFKKPVTPGDVLHYHAEIIRHRQGFTKFYAEAKVDGQVVTCAEMTCAVRSLA